WSYATASIAWLMAWIFRPSGRGWLTRWEIVMTDYAELRAALEAGPTPGPWTVRYDYVVQATSFDGGRLVPVAQPYGVNSDGTDLFANARMIAACHPEAIRTLLAERDALIHDNAEYVGAASALATENQRLREALRWAAGALLAVCGDGQATELDRFTLDGVTRTGTEILDMADAALAQGQGGGDASRS